MPRAHSRKSYKYDAALSFAGEDRSHAAALFRELRRRGLSVFYDADQQARLWGRSAREFEAVYGPQSRYVIPLISKHYVSKDWPRYEFETAKREERRRRDVFILPIRVDDSRILGLRDDVITLDVRRHAARDLAAAFAAKCRAQPRSRDRQVVGLSKGDSRLLLDAGLRRCLGLLARSVLPLPIEAMARLFPAYDWRRTVHRLARAGLVKRATVGIEVGGSVTRVLRADRNEWEGLSREWVARLQELEGHCDTAALLALHLIEARRLPEAARVVLDGAQFGELGHWNAIYLVLFEAFTRRRVFSKLDAKTRLEVVNSYGRCLMSAGRHAEASRAFARLQVLSRRFRNAWGIGQALLHAGLAAHQLGDDLRSERFYERCAVHARRTRDNFLLGRALNNLSLLQLDRNLDRAEQLLDASLAAKRRARDRGGMVAALGARGTIAAARHEYGRALRLYAAAVDAARREGMRHELAQSIYNLGRANQDLGRTKAAITCYERALRISEADGFLDVCGLAVGALARAAFESARYPRCAQLCERMATLGEQCDDLELQLFGLHMLACSLRAMGRDGRRAFRKALKIARAAARPEWIVRCLVDGSRARGKGGLQRPDVASVRSLARRETARGRADVAARLWHVVGDLEATAARVGNPGDAYLEADRLFAAVRSARRERLELQRAWYGWAWRCGRHQEAIGVLRRMERTANSLGDLDTAIGALDQRAHCWQELGRPDRAEPLHRTSVALSRRYANSEQLDRSLNNLGEALRRLGRPGEALAAFEESERIARQAARHADVLLVMRNRALSLLDLRRYIEAQRLLRLAQREARRRRLSDRSPGIVGTLANIMWRCGRASEAVRLYPRALRSARSHGQRGEEIELALNLAKVLRWHGQRGAALAVLQRYQSVASEPTQSLELLLMVAELLEKAGRLTQAMSVWSRARAIATEGRNGAAEQHCLAEETRVREHASSLARPDSWHVKRIHLEPDAERRATLMLERLRCLIAKKAAAKTAQGAFDEGLAFCEEHALHELKNRFYILVGDSQLSGGRRQRLTACQAYVLATIDAMVRSPRLGGEVSGHVFRRLASPDSDVAASALPELVEQLLAWAADKLAGTPVEVRSLVLWPYLEAKRLAPLRTHPDAYLEALGAVGDMARLQKEVAALASTRTTGASGADRRKARGTP